MAAFSSNGPALAGGGDLLKPDITAPGVDVIAARLPGGRQRQLLRRRVRHLDVEPAHRGYRGAADAEAPGLVADGGQVGDHDHRPARSTTWASRSSARRRHQRHPAELRRRPRHPGRRVRPGPGLRLGPRPTGSSTAAASASSSSVFGDVVCDSFGSIDPSNLNYPTHGGRRPRGQRRRSPVRSPTSTGQPGSTRPRSRPRPASRSKVSSEPLRHPAGPVGHVHGEDHPDDRAARPVRRSARSPGTQSATAATWSAATSRSARCRWRPRLEVAGSGTTGSTAISLTPGYTGTLTATPHGLAADAPGP